jgi:G3E family GTPase
VTAVVVRVPFNGDEILTTEVDGKPHVILRPALERLGVDYSTQLRKLKGKSWARVGTSPTQDQYRDMVTVDTRTFMMLLATIDENRVAADVKDVVVAYQAEVADAIEAYWTKGGAINPRASDDQLAAVIHRAEAQMRVLRLAEGLVDAAWLAAKTQHTIARALGEQPEVDASIRPLTVGEYLADRGLSGAALRSASTKFGRHLKARYRAEHGCEPASVERFVDNALRQVAGYSEADRPLFDAVWSEHYAPKPAVTS